MLQLGLKKLSGIKKLWKTSIIMKKSTVTIQMMRLKSTNNLLKKQVNLLKINRFEKQVRLEKEDRILTYKNLGYV